MKAVRVNADYESVLFHKSPQPKINEAIEFFALFLEERPLLSHKSYSAEYLSYVESVFGGPRKIIKSGQAENWWGQLSDLEREKELNSKLTSAQLTIDEKMSSQTFILRTEEDVRTLPLISNPMILKSPFEMSGRGFRLFPEGIGEKDLEIILSAVKKDPVILEPLLQRERDFSCYIFESGTEIFYENIVDKKFQYKGTLLRNWKRAGIRDLSFYSDISESGWARYLAELSQIKKIYKEKARDFVSGFSVDSFTYKSEEHLDIHTLCEVNYRRTMGRVSYELSAKYAQDRSWTMLLLLPPVEELFSKLGPSENWIILSPPLSRFGMIFLMADSEEKGRELLVNIKQLLSLGELPIRI